MRQRWLLLSWSIACGLFLVACVPTQRTVPAAEPVFYAAEPSEVFGSVILAISTSPGLDDSGGWVITSADAQGGFVRAETDVVTPGGFLRTESVRTESVTVVVAPAGENRTQVVIQRTSGGEQLAERIRSELRSRYGLN